MQLQSLVPKPLRRISRGARRAFMATTLVALGLTTTMLSSNCAHPTRYARTLDADTPQLRVMTYNVNFGIPGDEPTMNAISEGDADIVLLQETTPAWERALREELSDQYPHMTFHHCCGAGGLAVLSRLPFEERGTMGPAGLGWFPAWHGQVSTPLGPVQILSVHLRPPASDSGSILSGYFTTKPIREVEMKTYLRRLDRDVPTLIVGDFNEGHDGRALRHLEERGFRNALHEFAPRQHTWRWPTGLGELRQQLDHIVYSRGLEAAEARVLELGRSDHLPVVAVFERSRSRSH